MPPEVGKYGELYLKLTELLRSRGVDGQDPKEILESYPDCAKMNSITFHTKLRKIRQMLGNIREISKRFSVIFFLVCSGHCTGSDE